VDVLARRRRNMELEAPAEVEAACRLRNADHLRDRSLW
jgi:hypothetical protein